jgi:hypothetical protein
VRIVVNHSAKECVTICGVFRGVEDVLVPELVQIVLTLLIRPRNEHEAWPFLEQGQKANVFSPGSLGPFGGPAKLFYQGVTYGVQFELLGNTIGSSTG